MEYVRDVLDMIREEIGEESFWLGCIAPYAPFIGLADAMRIAADVSEERLRRFFQREEDGFRVRKEIREMVVFAPQNLIMDPPFTRLDLLSCRNLLIYLAPELQKRLLQLFHYSLVPGGLLCLGSSESLGACAGQFLVLDAKCRLFRRTEATLPVLALAFPPGHRQPAP